MATKTTQWLCDDKVSFQYFCNAGKVCTNECINNEISKLMRDFPEYYIYIGITHNPCGRFAGNYFGSTMPPELNIRIPLSLLDYFQFINETTHKDEGFDKMFVICYCMNEADIREREKDGISVAKAVGEKWVLNTTEGGNGKLKKKQMYYFLYACISKSKVVLNQVLNS